MYHARPYRNRFARGPRLQSQSGKPSGAAAAPRAPDALLDHQIEVRDRVRLFQELVVAQLSRQAQHQVSRPRPYGLASRAGWPRYRAIAAIRSGLGPSAQLRLGGPPTPRYGSVETAPRRRKYTLGRKQRLGPWACGGGGGGLSPAPEESGGKRPAQ